MPKFHRTFILLVAMFQSCLANASILASVPVDGSTGVSTVTSYSWDAIAGATSYDIDVSTDETFATTILSTNVPSNSHPGLILNSATVYYWRVRDVSGAGAGPYVVVGFETKAGTDTACGNPNQAIPDSPNPGVNDTITLGTGGNITDVNVSIVTTHTYIGDLIYTLTHNTTGTSVIIIDRPGRTTSGFGCSQNDINTTIDDAAAQAVENQCSSPAPALGAGPFSPNNPLSAVNGENVSGNWTLGVTDNAGADLGTFISWCLIPTTDGVIITADYSDLASTYGTAKHEGAGASKLGATWGADTDFSQDSDNAGDDGITTSGLWLPGSANAQITVDSTGGYMACWFDWDNSGVFEAGEKTIAQSIASGSVNIPVTIPGASSFGTVGDDFLETRCRFYQTEPVVLATESATGSANTGEVEDYRFPANELTPVSLVYTKSSQNSGSFSLDWMTTTETGAIGFNVYGFIDKTWALLNSKPITAKGIDSIDVQSYHFETSQGQIQKFKIEELASNGVKTTYGPYESNKQYGEKQQTRLINWQQINNQNKAKQQQLQNNAVNSYDYIKLKVTKAGLQRISYEDLLAKGVDWSGINSDQIAVSYKQNKVARYISSTSFGAGQYIEFIGQPHSTLYSNTNIYELSLDQNMVKESVEISSNNLILDAGAYQIAKTTLDQNLKYSFASPTSDPWYNQTFLTYASQKSWNIDLPAINSINNGIQSQLSYKLWSGTDWPGLSTDHHFKIDFNNVSVEDRYAQGISAIENSLVVNQAQTNNSVTITLPGDTGADYDLINLEELVLQYPAEIKMNQGVAQYQLQTTSTNVLHVFSNGFEETSTPQTRGETVEFTGVGIEVKGLVSQQVRAYATDKQELFYFTNLEFLSQSTGLSAVVPDLGTAQLDYYIYQETNITTPEIELGSTKPKPQGQYDYLMITHPLFTTQLMNLVDYHESQGTKVLVVEVNDIYSWYSNHRVDADSIKQYINYANLHNNIKTVLLVGGDSYDYTDNLGIGSVSYIPSLYIATDELIKYAPVDSLYADIDYDNIPDLAIGRLPVKTEQELQNVIAKTINFESRNYKKTAVFSSGREESFTNISNDLLNFLPQSWEVETAFISELEVAAAKNVLINSMENGSTLTSYFGHSSPRTWSLDRLYNTNDIDALNNTNKPTIINQFGCWSAYYVAPQYNTMAHRFLQKENSGAVAVMGASTLTESLHEAYLGNILMQKISQQGTSLGQAILQSKRELAQTHPQYIDVILGWNLLGDPMLEGF